MKQQLQKLLGKNVNKRGGNSDDPLGLGDIDPNKSYHSDQSYK